MLLHYGTNIGKAREDKRNEEVDQNRKCNEIFNNSMELPQGKYHFHSVKCCIFIKYICYPLLAICYVVVCF